MASSASGRWARGAGARARRCLAVTLCGWQGRLHPWAAAPTRALFSQFPSMKKTLEFKAHDGEIEDIALGPDNKVGGGWEAAGGSSLPWPRGSSPPRTSSAQVVTAGRDFQCCVWQRDQLVTGLCWNENLPGIPDKAYRYQACR